jgi:hypothetical protein
VKFGERRVHFGHQSLLQPLSEFQNKIYGWTDDLVRGSAGDREAIINSLFQHRFLSCLYIVSIKGVQILDPCR